MGSGVLIKRAIEKHGIENFEKTIFYKFDNEEEMNSKEAELVTEKFCQSDHTYNLCPGGKGGWGYVNSSGKNNLRKDYSKVSRALKGRKNPLTSKRMMGNTCGIGNKSFTGRTHNDETKQKISEAAKLRTGNKNSQFGTMWINNGIVAKKHKGEIPEGWTRGRKIK